MKTLLRFNDLKSKGVVNNRPQLKRMIDEYGFPPGIALTPNTRVWDAEQIDNWIAERTTARKPGPRRISAIANSEAA